MAWYSPWISELAFSAMTRAVASASKPLALKVNDLRERARFERGVGEPVAPREVANVVALTIVVMPRQVDEVLGSVHVVRVVWIFLGQQLSARCRDRGLPPSQPVHVSFFSLRAQPQQHGP